MAITRSQIARQLLQQGGVSMVDPSSDTKQEHIRRDVKITVEALPLGGDSKL